MPFSRVLSALLIAIVSFVPVAVRARQTFDVGKSAPAAPSFKKSFGSPPDPVVVARDLTCTPIAHVARPIDPLRAGVRRDGSGQPDRRDR